MGFTDKYWYNFKATFSNILSVMVSGRGTQGMERKNVTLIFKEGKKE